MYNAAVRVTGGAVYLPRYPRIFFSSHSQVVISEDNTYGMKDPMRPYMIAAIDATSPISTIWFCTRLTSRFHLAKIVIEHRGRVSYYILDEGQCQEIVPRSLSQLMYRPSYLTLVVIASA